MPIRRLVEHPVPGGERFSAVIGPVPVLRDAARALLGVALGSVAVAALWTARTPGSAGAVPAVGSLLWVAAIAFLASLTAGWLGGTREQLVCEGHHVIHRRTGALGSRRRTLRVLDLTAVRRPGGRLPVVGGIRLETTAGTWIVGRHLRAADSDRLVESLRLHLSLSGPLTRMRRPGFGAARPRATASATPDEALRRRLPEG